MDSNEPIKKESGLDSVVAEDDNNLPKFIGHLDSVNAKGQDAKKNETSMNDGKGKRIIFNEEHLRNKTFKGVEVPRKPYKKI